MIRKILRRNIEDASTLLLRVLTALVMTTYVRLELSLHDLAGLLADGRHGAVLVNFTSKLTCCVSGDFGDGATPRGDWHDNLRNLLYRVL